MENKSTHQNILPLRPLPPAFVILRNAISAYAKQWSLFIGISLIPAVCTFPLLFLREKDFLGVGIILLVLVFVITFIARVALFSAVIDEPGPMGDILEAYQGGIKRLIPFVFISILIVLATLGGFFLFVIPGVLLSVWLAFPRYVLFAENRRGLSALAVSWHYAKGYWFSIFWRLLFFSAALFLVELLIVFIIKMLSIFVWLPTDDLPTYIGWFFFDNLFVIPLNIIYTFEIYRTLKEFKADTFLEATEARLRRFLTIFLAVGTIAAFVLFAAGIVFVLITPPEDLPSPLRAPQTVLAPFFLSSFIPRHVIQDSASILSQFPLGLCFLK